MRLILEVTATALIALFTILFLMSLIVRIV
jgi:hypothetical protein